MAWSGEEQLSSAAGSRTVLSSPVPRCPLLLSLLGFSSGAQAEDAG